MAESQKMIFELYSKRKQADSALKYHILYAGSRDSINEKAALKELRQFEITSRNNEKERMMQITAKRKELRYTLLIISLLVATLISSLLYFLARGRSRRHKLEKEVALLNTRNLELEKERLENELKTQNKKLTTTDIYQIQKNEIINNIISKLQKHGITETRKHHSVWISDIINDLRSAQNQSAWEDFELRFQQVHTSFFRKLNEINPGLSPNDRRLCAFLKLNMTTKEISSITGQSYRSIEVARTRLRKKLNLTKSETGLIEFLSSL